MAKLIVHNPPTVKLKASGYTGTPTGDIELTENNRTYNVSPFATATTTIPEEEKTVTPSTAEQVITPDEGLLKKVTVNPTPLEEKTVAPSTEQQTIIPEAPAIGFSQFTVEPMPAPPVLIAKQITENGVYNATDDNADGYSEVTVAVPQDPYEVMNAYITNTLTRLRLNHVPANFLEKLMPGGNTLARALTSLQSIEFPDNQDGLPVWGYANLINLVLFDVGDTPKINNVSLHNCSSLESLILRKNDGVVTLHNTNSAPLSNANLRIYVPPTLIEDYKIATNWSTVPEKFRVLYYANSDTEKEQLLSDPTIPDESMIICDYNEAYVIKGATA